jgi:predicted nucleic acid-binding protein
LTIIWPGKNLWTNKRCANSLLGHGCQKARAPVCQTYATKNVILSLDAAQPAILSKTAILSTIQSTQDPCLLDTDVLIDYLRGYPPARVLFAQLPADCAVSAVSIAELHVGVREGAERKALALLLDTFLHVDLSAPIAAQGGLLRRDWGRSHGAGLNDALIAATALATGRVLLTLNAKHFPMLSKHQLLVPYQKPANQ